MDLAAVAPIGGVYLLLFLVRGVASPFFPLWFEDHGYSTTQISFLLAAPALVGLVACPLIAFACNGLAWRRTGLAAVAGLSALGFLMLLAGGVKGAAIGIIAMAWIPAATAIQAQLPLIDVLAMNAAKMRLPHYGQYRGLGTAAYVCANLAGGALIRALGSTSLLWWCAIMSLGGVLAALALPRRDWSRCPPPRRDPIWNQLLVLLRRPSFLAILLVAGLIELSHVYFYSFSSLLWRAEGASPTVIGSIRAVCALAEVAFLFGCEPWCRRVGPWGLLMIAGLASVVRWGCMALAPPLWLEACLQVLHALSYTATFVAALRLIQLTQDESLFQLGQAVCAAFVGGFIPGVGTLFCGALFSRFAAGGYYAMAGAAGLACCSAVLLRRQLTPAGAGLAIAPGALAPSA